MRLTERARGRRLVAGLPLVGLLVGLLVGMLGMLGGAAGVLHGQERSAPVSNDAALEALTRQVSAELRCPVCQGNSLQDSPSELAQEMKGVVRDQLASGRTPEQVKQYFIDKYGEWILLEPKASGFNLVVYLLPLVMVGVGGTVTWLAVRKWTAAPTGEDGEGEAKGRAAAP